MTGIHSFPKSQKLKSRKTISALFDGAANIRSYPYKMLYINASYSESLHESHVQLGVTVPKRLFRRAVDRNRIKRQIRENYRAYHHELLDLAKAQNIYLAIMVIYTAREALPFAQLDHAMNKAISKLIIKINKTIL